MLCYICCGISFAKKDFMNQDYSVSKVTGYGLNNQGLIPGVDRDPSLGCCIYTTRGAHPISYAISTEEFFPRHLVVRV